MSLTNSFLYNFPDITKDETSTFRDLNQQSKNPLYCDQGRREKFRTPEQNFRLDPLVSGAPKSRDEQNKGHSVRRCSNFGPKSSDEQKKGHSLRRCSNFGSAFSDEQNKVIASADVRISA